MILIDQSCCTAEDELWHVARQMQGCLHAAAVNQNSSNHHGNYKTIVITGANSGIGLAAAKLLVLLSSCCFEQQTSCSDNYRLVLVCRTQQKAEAAADKVRKVLLSSATTTRQSVRIIPLACDQSSLDDVYRFNERIRHALAQNGGRVSVDVLCLNAALLAGRDDPIQYTQDDLEQTFQINYLSTFLLANLLVDVVTPHFGRIIISTSGLHVTTQVNTCGMLQRRFAMPDGSNYHYKRAYALSKVFLVVLCAELQRRHPEIMVNCFSPGLMMESGLFRNQNATGVEKLRQHNPHAMANAKSVAWGAGALYYMMMVANGHGEYWSDRESQLGNDAVYGKHFTAVSIMDSSDDGLWRISHELIDRCRQEKGNSSMEEYKQVVG